MSGEEEFAMVKERVFEPGDITSITIVCPKCGDGRRFTVATLPSSLTQRCANPKCQEKVLKTKGTAQTLGEGLDAMQVFKLLLEFKKTLKFTVDA